MNQNLVLGIQTYGGGNAALERHWPFFQRSGAGKFVVITTIDEHCWVPEEVDSIAISKSGYIDGLHLPIRWLRTLEYLISLDIPWIGIAEYDTVFLREIPALEKGFTAHLTGGKPAGCECSWFSHNPWCMDRDTAVRLWSYGWAMIRSGMKLDESPDCYIGQLVERSNTVRHDFDLYTQNTIKEPWQIEEARKAVQREVNAVHGVKTKEVLDVIFAP